MWPPVSLDISPMNFALRSILKREVSHRSSPNFESLKAAIKSNLINLDEKVVRRSCASMKARLKLIIKAKSDNFEIKSVHKALNILLKSCV